MSQGRNHLLCAKLQLFRHQLPQPNILFSFPPQKSSSVHLSPDLSGRPVSQNPGGDHGTGGLLILLFFPPIYVGREDREGWEKLLVLKI
jgi:hypothetical protein